MMFNPALLFSIKTFFFCGKRKVLPFLLRRSRTQIFRKDTADSQMAQEGLLSSQPRHGLIAVPAIHGKLPQCVEVTTIPMFFEGVSVFPYPLWIYCRNKKGHKLSKLLQAYSVLGTIIVGSKQLLSRQIQILFQHIIIEGGYFFIVIEKIKQNNKANSM